MSILFVYLCNLGRTDLICSACDLDDLKSSGAKSTSTKKNSSTRVLQFRLIRPKLYHIMLILLVYLCNLGQTDLNCNVCDLDVLNVLNSSGENPQVRREAQALESCSLGRTDLNCSACDFDFVKSSGENPQVQRKTQAHESCTLGRTDLNCIT